jgi:hypothetical protein
MIVKACIHAQWDSWNKKWTYHVFSFDMTTQGYILLETREIPFQSPNDRALKEQFAALLRAKKTQVMADATAEMTEIDGQIQELLALEDHSGEES